MYPFNNSNDKSNDKSNMSTFQVSSTTPVKAKQLYNQLTDGLSDKEWGYGLRRIKLAVEPAVNFLARVPYTFTSSGFKSQDGEWFVCVRMNVDQHSPQKMRPMNAREDIYQLWGEMMLEFADEYAAKHNQ